MSTYAYVRASDIKQESSPDTQRRICEEHMQRLGQKVDACFSDPATYSKMPIWERPAGSELMTRVVKGDTVVVAHLDRLTRSFFGFAKILESFEKLGVVLFVCDFPGGHFDPKHALSRVLMHILISFADYEHAMIKQRTREGLAALKAQGKRATRHAPFGFRWEKRWDYATQRWFFVTVRNEEEWKIMALCVELQAKDIGINKICTYLNDVLKVKNRQGGVPRPTTVNKWIKIYMRHMLNENKYNKVLLPGDEGENSLLNGDDDAAD